MSSGRLEAQITVPSGGWGGTIDDVDVGLTRVAEPRTTEDVRWARSPRFHGWVWLHRTATSEVGGELGLVEFGWLGPMESRAAVADRARAMGLPEPVLQSLYW